LHEDWQLLQKIDEAGEENLTKKSDQGNQTISESSERSSD
jgi:hypothetical protein